MKKKINFTNFSIKSLSLLYLLSKRNKDIKNKVYYIKNHNPIFFKFNFLLKFILKNKIKYNNTNNLLRFPGLFRQVNLLLKYNSQNLNNQYNRQIDDNFYIFDNSIFSILYLQNIKNIYKLLLLLNQNLYVIK